MQERMRKKYHYGWAGNTEHKKGTKCSCHRSNSGTHRQVSKRPTDKRISMERKWNKDQYGNIRKITDG